MNNFLNYKEKTTRIFYTEHALEEMNTEEEVITPEEVREVISKGEIIEDYPEDRRGHSYLISFYTSQRKHIHVVCAPKESYLTIITVYIPTSNRWKGDFKTRRK